MESDASVMSALQLSKAPKGGYGGEVLSSDKIADIAPKLKTATKAFAVIDKNGIIVGQVTRDDVINILMQG